MYILFYVLLFIGVLLVVKLLPFLCLRLHRKVNNNLCLAAKILNTKEKFSLFGTRRLIEGYYKDRKIILYCDFLEEITEIEAKVSPQIVFPQQKRPAQVLAKPTENTHLRDKAIYYEAPFRDRKTGRHRACSEEEIIAVFEELVRAARIVETTPTR